MQLRHRGGERQAEARARPGAARFEPDEAFENPVALMHGDALALVGDDDVDAVADAPGGDDYGRRAMGASLAVLDGVVHQIGEGLADQLAIAPEDQRAAGL